MLTAFSPGTVICHRAAPVITVIWQPTTTSSNRKLTVSKQLQLCQAVSSAQAAAPLPRRHPCTLLHRRDTRRSFPFPSSGWAGAPPIITHHHDQQRRAAAAPCALAQATHSQNGGQQQERGTETMQQTPFISSPDRMVMHCNQWRSRCRYLTQAL